jgi:hypothetical protein
VALFCANVIFKRWSALTRLALYGVMLLATLGTLGVYSADALWPRAAQGAFVFIVVPPVTWLLSAIVVALVATYRRSSPIDHEEVRF